MTNLDEVSEKVYRRLLERFGEPIGAAPYAVGVADDRARRDEGEHEDELDEVTPPGYEKIVKGLKRSKSVENPWAVAWWMKGKGIKPKK
jgi:hypothetical protein